MAEITAAARLAGRESVAIFDNLHGQTTQTHLANLARNRCKRHLLPSNTTDELQLVDAGVGHALKTEMAHLHDEWLSIDDNLELWTTPTNFPVWRKRAPRAGNCASLQRYGVLVQREGGGSDAGERRGDGR